VYGPNGFLYEINGTQPTSSTTVLPEVTATVDAAGGRVVLTLTNTGSAACTFTVAINNTAYSKATPHTFKVSADTSTTSAWDVTQSAYWYDLVVTVDADAAFRRRFAGHVETGATSMTDPAIAAA
jgi:phospholipase C